MLLKTNLGTSSVTISKFIEAEHRANGGTCLGVLIRDTSSGKSTGSHPFDIPTSAVQPPIWSPLELLHSTGAMTHVSHQ